MSDYQRFAVYYTAPAGPLATFGANWLGWDMVSGQPAAHPDIPGLTAPVAELTATPRKYGFHGTLKAPFRLAPGTDAAMLLAGMRSIAGAIPPVTLANGLKLARLGGFLALIPKGGDRALNDLAADLVRELDLYRAPLSDREYARRKPETLSPAQREHLDRWGYPYVMEEFRFHMTLTGDLPTPQAQALCDALIPVLDPLLTTPYVIDAISLAGEDTQGRFHLIQRVPLTG